MASSITRISHPIRLQVETTRQLPAYDITHVSVDTEIGKVDSPPRITLRFAGGASTDEIQIHNQYSMSLDDAKEIVTMLGSLISDLGQDE